MRLKPLLPRGTELDINQTLIHIDKQWKLITGEFSYKIRGTETISA